MMNVPGPGRSMQRRSPAPGTEPGGGGLPPNIPARSISPAVGMGGPMGAQAGMSRSSAGSSRSVQGPGGGPGSGGGGSTRRNNVSNHLRAITSSLLTMPSDTTVIRQFVVCPAVANRKERNTPACCHQATTRNPDTMVSRKRNRYPGLRRLCTAGLRV